MTNEPSDRDLVLTRAVTRGDSGALGELYDRHASSMLALGMRMLGDRSEAESLLADVFLEVWRHPERYDSSRGTLQTYLLMLMRSRALDRLRRTNRQRAILDRNLGALDGGTASFRAEADPDPHATVVGHERRATVRRALVDLSEDQRQAVLLAYYEGLSHSEIARRLDAPIGTIKSRIRSGLLRLRESLGAAYGTPGPEAEGNP